jgi:hypothetical protein
MAEQMMQQPEQMPPQQDPNMQAEQGASPEQMRDAAAGGSGDVNEVHERFVLNVMKLASDQEHEKVIAFMQSAKESPAQGFGRALFFILEAVKEGLESKKVEIPSELWLSENGIIEQSAKIIAILGIKSGVQLDEQAVNEGIEMAAEALAETDDMRKQQAQEPEQPPQQQMPQQPEQPAQAPQQGGLLSQAGVMPQ